MSLVQATVCVLYGLNRNSQTKSTGRPAQNRGGQDFLGCGIQRTMNFKDLQSGDLEVSGCDFYFVSSSACSQPHRRLFHSSEGGGEGYIMLRKQRCFIALCLAMCPDPSSYQSYRQPGSAFRSRSKGPKAIVPIPVADCGSCLNGSCPRHAQQLGHAQANRCRKLLCSAEPASQGTSFALPGPPRGLVRPTSSLHNARERRTPFGLIGYW